MSKQVKKAPIEIRKLRHKADNQAAKKKTTALKLSGLHKRLIRRAAPGRQAILEATIRQDMIDSGLQLPRKVQDWPTARQTRSRAGGPLDKLMEELKASERQLFQQRLAESQRKETAKQKQKAARQERKEKKRQQLEQKEERLKIGKVREDNNFATTAEEGGQVKKVPEGHKGLEGEKEDRRPCRLDVLNRLGRTEFNFPGERQQEAKEPVLITPALSVSPQESEQPAQVTNQQPEAQPQENSVMLETLKKEIKRYEWPLGLKPLNERLAILSAELEVAIKAREATKPETLQDKAILVQVDQESVFKAWLRANGVDDYLEEVEEKNAVYVNWIEGQKAVTIHTTFSEALQAIKDVKGFLVYTLRLTTHRSHKHIEASRGSMPWLICMALQQCKDRSFEVLMCKKTSDPRAKKPHLWINGVNPIDHDAKATEEDSHRPIEQILNRLILQWAADGTLEMPCVKGSRLGIVRFWHDTKPDLMLQKLLNDPSVSFDSVSKWADDNLGFGHRISQLCGLSLIHGPKDMKRLPVLFGNRSVFGEVEASKVELILVDEIDLASSHEMAERILNTLPDDAPPRELAIALVRELLASKGFVYQIPGSEAEKTQQKRLKAAYDGHISFGEAFKLQSLKNQKDRKHRYRIPKSAIEKTAEGIAFNFRGFFPGKAQLKGQAFVNQAFSGYVIVTHSSNFKDGGKVDAAFPTMRWVMDAQPGKDVGRWNAQYAAMHPGLVEVEELQVAVRLEIDRLIEKIKTQGCISTTRELDDATNWEDDEHEHKIHKNSVTTIRRRQLAQAKEMFGPDNVMFPTLEERALRSELYRLLDTDAGKFNIPLPWMLHRQVVSEIAALTNNPSLKPLTEGQIGYDSEAGVFYVQTERFINEVVPNHGGSDMDDFYDVLIRRALVGGEWKLVAILLRCPTFAGEWSYHLYQGKLPEMETNEPIPLFKEGKVELSVAGGLTKTELMRDEKYRSSRIGLDNLVSKEVKEREKAGYDKPFGFRHLRSQLAITESNPGKAVNAITACVWLNHDRAMTQLRVCMEDIIDIHRQSPTAEALKSMQTEVSNFVYNTFWGEYGEWLKNGATYQTCPFDGRFMDVKNIKDSIGIPTLEDGSYDEESDEWKAWVCIQEALKERHQNNLDIGPFDRIIVALEAEISRAWDLFPKVIRSKMPKDPKDSLVIKGIAEDKALLKLGENLDWLAQKTNKPQLTIGKQSGSIDKKMVAELREHFAVVCAEELHLPVPRDTAAVDVLIEEIVKDSWNKNYKERKYPDLLFRGEWSRKLLKDGRKSRGGLTELASTVRAKILRRAILARSNDPYELGGILAQLLRKVALTYGTTKIIEKNGQKIEVNAEIPEDFTYDPVAWNHLMAYLLSGGLNVFATHTRSHKQEGDRILVNERLSFFNPSDHKGIQAFSEKLNQWAAGMPENQQAVVRATSGKVYHLSTGKKQEVYGAIAVQPLPTSTKPQQPAQPPIVDPQPPQSQEPQQEGPAPAQEQGPEEDEGGNVVCDIAGDPKPLPSGGVVKAYNWNDRYNKAIKPISSEEFELSKQKIEEVKQSGKKQTVLFMTDAEREQFVQIMAQTSHSKIKYSTTKPNLQWNDEQKAAIDQVNKFLHDPNAKCLVFKGYAGTGKTTVISHCLENYLKDRRRNVIFTATSNEATGVLKGAIYWLMNANPEQVDCMTAHKAHSLVVKKRVKWVGKEAIDETWCERKTRKDKSSRRDIPVEPITMGYKVVVIDECSMVDTKLMKWVVDDASRYGYKVIFMGDPAQLPPIKEMISQSFAPPMEVWGSLELTKVMRMSNEKDSMKLVARAREAVDIEGVRCPRSKDLQAFCARSGIDLNNSDLSFKNNAESMKFIKEMVQSEEFRDNVNHFRALAYTNERIDYLNDRMRGWYLGELSQIREILPDERLRFDAPYKTPSGEEIDNGTRVHVHFAVPSVTSYEHEQADGKWVTFYFETYHIYVEDMMGQKFWVCYLSQNELERFRTILNEQADLCEEAANQGKKPWRPFYQLKEYFGNLNYSYAMTVHSAQGSTINHVWVDVNEITGNTKSSNTEKKKLLYVAFGRAKQTVTCSC